VAPSQIGSVEFAAARFGVQLVVVMGHTRCGAIDATIEAIEGRAPMSHHVASIVDLVRPAVEGLVRSGLTDRDQLRHEAVRANVRESVRHLESSPLIHDLVAGGLRIVGAEHDLATGRVEFFAGLPLGR
jgi:carbonic anhydrase